MSGFNLSRLVARGWLSRLVARGWLIAAIIAGTGALTASPSYGQNIATTTASVNQRTGPGTSYAVVQVLPAGATVSVSQCTSSTGWCELVYRSRNGWVSARYLNFAGAAASGDPAPPVVTPPQGGQVQAQATVQLNMRRGPDTSYATIRAIPAGAIVPVFRCTNSYLWCEVAYGGSTGWVSARYLRSTSAQYQQQPLPNVAAQLGLQLFNFIIGQVTGQQPQPPQGPRVPGPGEVCFYADFDYAGAVTCTNMGQNQPALGGDWNDRISSIRVGQNAWTEVCTDYNYGGTCRVVTQNTARLPIATNDRISSYRTTQGGGGNPIPGPGPGPQARACFYSDWNYAGAGFCLSVNQDLATLPADWNDRISSIRLDPGVTVQVCQDGNYGGWCEQYTGDVPQLLDPRNDAISSIRVR